MTCEAELHGWVSRMAIRWSLSWVFPCISHLCYMAPLMSLFSVDRSHLIADKLHLLVDISMNICIIYAKNAI